MLMTAYRTGIEELLEGNLRVLAGRRVALVAHPASLTSRGDHSARLLWEHPEVDLVCLFGPEHGFQGAAGAGEDVSDSRHPEWDIPVYSLYGETRKPTPAMLEDVDVIVFDLQDLGVRCYTYLSTLRYILEAAVEQGKTVVVADRPVPQPAVIDGPVLSPAFESFVGNIEVPLVYGMTPGEAALWITRYMGFSADLFVSRMTGYTRDASAAELWPMWVPPSPAIRSWLCAVCYPATVFCEALPSIDCRRSSELAFQVVHARWIVADDACRALRDAALPGVTFLPDDADGIRMEITDATVFKPVTAGLSMLAILQDLYGEDAVWGHAATREDFFDQLMGTDWVRLSLLEGRSGPELAAAWQEGIQLYEDTRMSCLLYQ